MKSPCDGQCTGFERLHHDHSQRGKLLPHANEVSEIEVRSRARAQGPCWPLAIDVKA